jgi:hypothetical protein
VARTVLAQILEFVEVDLESALLPEARRRLGASRPHSAMAVEVGRADPRAVAF